MNTHYLIPIDLLTQSVNGTEHEQGRARNQLRDMLANALHQIPSVKVPRHNLQCGDGGMYNDIEPDGEWVPFTYFDVVFRQLHKVIDDQITEMEALEAKLSAFKQTHVAVIVIEKMLCQALGREWSAAGISIVSLVDDLTALIAYLRSERNQFEAAYNEWADKSDWARANSAPAELGQHLADVIKGRFDALGQSLAVRNIVLADALQCLRDIRNRPDCTRLIRDWCDVTLTLHSLPKPACEGSTKP